MKTASKCLEGVAMVGNQDVNVSWEFTDLSVVLSMCNSESFL